MQETSVSRAVDDAEHTARITEIHAMSDRTYGAPRIRAELAEVDWLRVNIKRIARLMRKAGIAGGSRRGLRVTTMRDGDAMPTPDLVGRNFKADGPHKLWVADITYIPTWAGFLFLAVVIDVWSAKVVRWSMLSSILPIGPGLERAQRPAPAQIGRKSCVQPG